MLFSFEFHNTKESKMPKMPKWSKCQDAKKRCQNQKMIESPISLPLTIPPFLGGLKLWVSLVISNNFCKKNFCKKCHKMPDLDPPFPPNPPYNTPNCVIQTYASRVSNVYPEAMSCNVGILCSDFDFGERFLRSSPQRPNHKGVIPCQNMEKKGQRQKITFLWRDMKEYRVLI